MDDSAEFANVVRNTVIFTTQQKINVITNFVEYFGSLLAVKDGYIDTFVRYTHSANNARATVQRILISKTSRKDSNPCSLN